MPRKRTAYQCDFCKKVYLTEKTTIAHEKWCYHNPKNKACVTCLNFSQGDLAENICDSNRNIEKKLKYKCYAHRRIPVM